MAGRILTEYIEYLENTFGEDQAQIIINVSKVESKGAYVKTSLYDHQEFFELLKYTVSESGIQLTVLMDRFCDHLLDVFKQSYEDLYTEAEDALDMFERISAYMIDDVKSYNPKFEASDFEYIRAGNKLTLLFESLRPLAPFIKALLEACIRHFGGIDTLLHASIADDEKSGTFIIQST